MVRLVIVRRIMLRGALWLAALAGAGTAHAQTQYDPAVFGALRWQNIGPARGGRSITVAGSTARPFEYYFGATGGGVWKTTDGGQNWQPVTDGQLKSSSVGAVAVCEANPDVVYAGMGETQLRGNIMQGDGVYKSLDAGKTWRHVGLAQTQAIARIRIHPTDCNTAWVAAFGVHSAPNAERGVFKTTNGGETWRKVLFRDERTGAVDLSVDPNNPAVIYAALWEAWRKSWGMSSGGPGSGLFKSTDYGETWREITRNPGLPATGVVGKIGVAVSPAAPWRVYAIVEHDSGGVFRSDDAGATWTRVNDERRLRQRAFYYTRIYADPKNPDVVYVLNTGFYRSRDGGKTYQGIQVPHGDNHDLWIAPDNPDRMINSNDGGANVSVNGGQTWTEQDFPTAQFYRVITTHHEPYLVCGAQQDNSTACAAHKGWQHLGTRGGGSGTFFFPVGGGESGHIANSPADPNIFYAGSYGGLLTRFDYRTGQERVINVWPENPMGHASAEIRERFQWTFPIVFSRHDPNVLYVASQHVWKTTNEGQTWERISPDLSRHDPTTMVASGGPITKDQTGVETYALVFALAPSYQDPNVLWAGSDDGLVHVTRDGGRTWQNVTPKDAPPFVRINTIEASPTTAGKAYVAGIRYLVDNDRAPYVWRTTDYGATWTKIVNGIPGDDFVRAVREDPKRPGLLYAASEHTVYVSWDDGANWQRLTQNLPDVQVSDLVVEENDLVISTHGRSFWVMYNIGPLRQLTPQVAQADVHLFDPVDPTRGVDPNVQVFYNLKRDVDSLTLEFLDAAGNVIQVFKGTKSDTSRAGGPPPGVPEEFAFFGGPQRPPAVRAGSHSFTWNLRYPGYTDFDGRIFWAAGNQGPVAPPGRYQVRLTTGGASQTQDFEIKMDPRLQGKVTVAQLRERFDFALKIRDRVSDANEEVIRIRRMKSDVDDRLKRTSDAAIARLGQTVKTKVSGVEEEIYQVRNRSNQDPLNFPIKLNNKLAALMGVVESADAPPTAQSLDVFRHLDTLLQKQSSQLEAIIATDVAQLNELLRNANLPPINTEKPKREPPGAPRLVP
ncbi:MAG TPA: glycosyl hydrolase [Gemmatimonadales bacterium]|nr:glycosyl hydrolase [Gemmatimonadales bacterium]